MSRARHFVLAACFTMLSVTAQSATVDLARYAGVQMVDEVWRSAQVDLTDAQAALYFSNGQSDPTRLPAARPSSVTGAVGFLNAASVTLSPLQTAALDEKVRTVGSLNKVTRTVVGVTPYVTGISVNSLGTSFALQDVRAVGGLQLNAPSAEFALGGSVKIDRLQVDMRDPGNVQVSGSISGAPLMGMSPLPTTFAHDGTLWEGGQLAGATSMNLHDILLATEGDLSQLQAQGITVVGQETFNIAGTNRTVLTLQMRQVVSGLQMGARALDVLSNSLGLLPGDVLASKAGDINGAGGWGTLTITSTFKAYNSCLECDMLPPITPSVPEPQSWALMALGLAGLAWRITRVRSA